MGGLGLLVLDSAAGSLSVGRLSAQILLAVELDVLQAMASALRERSASASIPSFTADAFDHVPRVSSLLPLPEGAATWVYTTLAVVLSLLVLEQTVWRFKKRHLPGDSWIIPIIGRFADSMSPTLENYMKQWNSGPLSVVSVFNM